jgi:hypothetical protein
MTDLNIKHKTIKLLEDNTGKNLDGNTKGMIHGTKKIIWAFIKIKNFCSTKDTVKRINPQTENIFKGLLDKVPSSKTH